MSDGEGGLVVENLANGRTQTIRWCEPCYRGHLDDQKADKIPEATAEDYAESERYWHNQKLKLDRLGKEVRIFNGKEILVPKGSPEKTKARRVDSTESIKKTPPRKPTRIIIIDPDGTVTLIGF